MIKILCILMIAISLELSADNKYHAQQKERYLVVKNPSYNPGMFSVFNSVAGFLHFYENNPRLFCGLTVDFGTEGLYYDPSKGPNWWEYYCEPVELGLQTSYKPCFKVMTYCRMAELTEKKLSRKDVAHIVNKYIRIKQSILKEVYEFVDVNFKGYFVICLHYRGTDKSSEAPRVPYEAVIQAVEKQIRKLDGADYRIFVATDEQPFFDYISTVFTDKVLAKDHYRSNDDQPLHMVNPSPAEQGRQSIIDALLLSKGDLLIRTSSNLSLWSIYFNPKIKVINLSKRFKNKRQLSFL